MIVPNEEFIERNYNKTLELINTTVVDSNRKNKLLKMIEHFGERYAVAPASTRKDNHSAFPGGLCYHNLHVLQWIDKFQSVMAPGQFSNETLLGGTGVGYSVQKNHVEKLPTIKKPLGKRRRFLIPDSIEGWADAVKVLVKAYFFSTSNPEFDYSAIRPKGAPLKTAGGKAPGPEPLRKCLDKVRDVFDSKGINTKLSPIEVHDILCHIADAVLSGGIRRSAMISLFSFDDEDMIKCKYGNWVEVNQQRSRANNSAVILRHRIKEDEFFEFWEKIQNSNAGEPGIFLSNNSELGTNPSLRAGTKVLTTNGIFPIEQLESKEFFVKNLFGQISRAKCFLSGRISLYFLVSARSKILSNESITHLFLQNSRDVSLMYSMSPFSGSFLILSKYATIFPFRTSFSIWL